MVDFEGRASRRPMPRRLDVSDWDVDSDVRSGVSSSLSRYLPAERGTSESRAAPTDPNRRLTNGNELRPAAPATLRPVNRYDADVTSCTKDSTASSVSVSSWRTSGAFLPSSGRRTDERRRATVSAPTQERLQPRSTQDMRRHTSGLSLGYSRTHSSERDESQSQTLRPARDRETRTPRASDADSSVETTSAPSNYRLEPSSTYFSPPRAQAREPTTPATVSSDASTPPYTPSVTDTPSTIRSASHTPRLTPSKDDSVSTRQPHSSISPAHDSISDVSSDDSTPETTASMLDCGAVESVVHSARHPREMNDGSRRTMPSHLELSLQQQREQLYDFRRDMRHVFARVDEMVDMHRELFKSDPSCGTPHFNTTTAHDTASFTSETFEQLTALRTRFEELAKAWTPPSDSSRPPTPLRPPQRAREPRVRPSPLDETSSMDTVHVTATVASSQSMETIELPSCASSVASSPRTDQAAHHTLGLGRRPAPIAQWEPTISSRSNPSSPCSSPSSSSSLSLWFPSTTIPVFRPSTHTPRINAFEDFDKRMEEIRASLQSIARDRPRVAARVSSSSPPSSTTSSSLPHAALTANKFRAIGGLDSGSDHEVTTLENTSHASNRIHSNTSDESRKDREARLRQLLRELRETGDKGEDAASAWG